MVGPFLPIAEAKMKTKLKIGGKEIEVEVMSPEKIAESGAPLVSLPTKDALFPLDEKYIPGTKAGYPCSICGQDCILAPSGQAQVALKQNPVMCSDCFVDKHRTVQ